VSPFGVCWVSCAAGGCPSGHTCQANGLCN
jgi:hypothetical protein